VLVRGAVGLVAATSRTIANRRAARSLGSIGTRIRNIAGRLDRDHLSAARLEGTGRLTTGFDHVQELTAWANGLRSSIRRLNGILGDPDLHPDVRARAEGLLSQASRALDAIEGALRQ
jgi:hypothetical protein